MRKFEFRLGPLTRHDPNRPEEGGADEFKELRKKARGHKKKGKPKIEPAWVESSPQMKGGE
jgi:hypothetical protein